MRFLLLNSVRMAAATLRPAKELDSDVDDVAAIAAAGGVVVALPNPALEARAARAREEQARGRWVDLDLPPVAAAVVDVALVVDEAEGPGVLSILTHPDRSIVKTSEGVRVGALSEDSQHGPLNGGNLHALATHHQPGFMSAEDKIRLDALVRRFEQDEPEEIKS